MELGSRDNGFEESSVKETDERWNEFEDNEAKVQNEEEGIDVVLQTIEDIMEFQQELRKDAEQVYDLENVDLLVEVVEESSSLEASWKVKVPTRCHQVQRCQLWNF